MILSSETRVNTYRNAEQTESDSALLTDGSYVTVWQSQSQDGSGFGVYFQRFSAQGAALGPELRANTGNLNNQSSPHVAGLSDGGFVLIWEDDNGYDGSSNGVYGQRYDAAGVAQGGNFLVNTTTNSTQYQADVAAYTGGFATVWLSFQPNNYDVFLQRWNNDGSKNGSETLISTTPVSGGSQAGTQQDAQVAARANGDLFIVWTDQNGNDGGSYGVYGKRYIAATASFSDTFLVNTTTAGLQYEPAVAMLSDGGAIVVWRSDGQDGSGAGVYGQRYDSAGAKAGGEFLVNQSTANNQYQPAVTGLSTGGFVVAWYNDWLDVSNTGSTQDVYVREYDAAGNALTGQVKLASLSNSTESQPSITDLGGGRYVVSYSDNTTLSGIGNDIVQQIFGPGPLVAQQQAPTLGNFSGSVTFAENLINATPQPIQIVVGLTDLDSANFDGGRLDLFFVQGSTADDVLGIRSVGDGPNQIRVDGSNLRFQGQIFGTFSGGGPGGNLVVTFNANATVDAVEELIQNLTYSSTSQSPAASRTVGIRVSDGDGGSSASSTMTINVTAETDGAPARFGEQTVNSYTVNDQQQPAVAALADGGYVVAWQSYDQDSGPNVSSTYGIYYQRYSPQGVAIGGEYRVNTVNASTQEAPRVAGLSNGGFVIVWDDAAGVDGSGQGVVGQIYSAAGTPVGGNLVLNPSTANTQQYSDVAAYAGGGAVAAGFVAVWSSPNVAAGNGWEVFLQRYDNSGARIGGETVVSALPGNPGVPAAGTQYQSRVDAYPNGDLVIVWRDDSASDGAGVGVFGRKYFAASNTFGTPFQVNTTTTGNQYEADVAVLGNGGFVVVWRSDGQDGSGAGVFGQRFDAAGSKVGGEFRVNESTLNNQYQPAVTALSTGGFVVSFYNDSTDVGGVGSSNDVYIREYDASGNPVDGQRKLVSPSDSTESQPAVAGLAGGSFVVAYTDFATLASGGNNTNDIVQQIFASTAQVTRQADPVIGDFNASVTFLENNVNAARQIIDSAVSVSDADSPDFAGGSIHVYYVKFGQPTDQLAVRDQGSATGQIGVNLDTISYGGTPIGTWVGGSNGSELKITLLAAATPDAVQALLQNLTYGTTSQSPAGSRVLALRISDGDGGASAPSTFTINVTPQLDGAPLVYGETRVNTYVTNNQQDPEVAVLADGSYVVVWQSTGQDGSSEGVYAQRYTSQGAAIGGEVRLNTSTAGAQEYAHVAGLKGQGGGGFVTVWQDASANDGSGYGVFAQRFDANGTPVGAQTVVTSFTSSNQYHGVVDSYNGGYAVVWASTGNAGGNSYDIYLKRFDNGGAVVTADTLVSTLTATPATAQTGQQELPDVAAYANGNLVIVWQDYSGLDGAGYGVFGRLYNAATGSFTPTFQVNTSTAGNQHEPSVATLADGGFVVIWRNDAYDGSGAAVLGQRFSAAGTAVGGEFQVNQAILNNQFQPAVTGLSTGGFVVTFYNDYFDSSGGGTTQDVYIREYDASGNAVDGERKLPSASNSTEQSPAIADLGGGNFVVVYADSDVAPGGNGSFEIQQQIFGSAATLARQADPQVGGFGGTLTFAENLVNATAQLIDPAVALTDVDSADFDGGRVDLFYVQGGGSGDQLSVRNQGIGAGQIGLSSGTVTYGGTPIGTLSGGANGGNLQITLNASASVEAVESLIQNLTYGNSSQSPQQTRTVGLRVSDGDGGSSATGTVTINVTRETDGTPLAYGESQVNSYRSNNQDEPEIAVLTDGSYVIVWNSASQDGSSTGVYGQRFGANGLPLGAEFQVSTVTANAQDYPHVAALSNGGFVVVWQDNAADGSSYGVFAQRYDSAGVAQGGNAVVPSFTTNQQYHGVVAGYTGGYSVVWASQTNPGGNSFDIYLRRFDNNGTALAPEVRVSDGVGVATAQTGQQELPDVAAFANGNLVIVWQDYNANDGAGNGVFGRTYNATTATFGPTFQVNTTTASSQYEPSVATLSDGGFVIVWRDDAFDGNSFAVVGQRYDATGARVGGEFLVNETTAGGQYQPAVTGLSTGGFVVTWYNDSADYTGQGTTQDIYVREFTAAGLPVDSEVKLASASNSTELMPAIADLGNGNFVVAYADIDNGPGGNSSYEIKQQIFGSTAEMPRPSANPVLDDLKATLTLSSAAANALNPATPQLIDNDLSVSDSDSADFGGGVLTVYFLSGAVAADVLGLRNQGVATGQVGVSGSTVSFGGTAVGTLQLGSATQPLTVTFNPSATAAAVQAVAENVVYSNAAIAVGTTTARQVAMRLSDGDGGVSDSDVVTINIQPTVTPVTLLLDDVTSSLTITETQAKAGALIDAAVAVDYTGASGFANGRLTVTYTSSTNRPEEQIVVRNVGAGTGQVALIGNDVQYEGVSIGTVSATANGLAGNNLDIVFKAAATAQAVERVIENLVYTNASSGPLPSRSFSINVTDGAGNSGTARTVTLNVTSEAEPTAATRLFGETQVNTYEPGDQNNPAVATLQGSNAGGYVVVWESQAAQDGSGYGVFAQRFDANGSANGPEFQVNTFITSNQATPAVASLTDGGFVVAWRSDSQDGSGSYGVYAQRYGADGSPQGSEFRANTTTISNQYEPAVLGLSDGSFIVAYRSDYSNAASTTTNDVLAQRFTATGVPLGTELTLNTTGGATQFEPQLAALAGGGFVAIWSDTSGDASGVGIGAQIFTNAGVKVGGLIAVNTTTAGTQSGPDVAALAGGGFVAAWESGNTVYAQRFDASGAKLGGELTVNTVDTPSNQNNVMRVVGLASGGFVVAWDGTPSSLVGGSSQDVTIQQFDASGNKVDGARIVNTTLPSTQYAPDLAALTGGNLVVVWAGYNAESTVGSTYGVFQQLLGTAGSITQSTPPLLVDMTASVSYGENLVNATPQIIDRGVALVDPDSPNFAGGRLWVSVISGYGSVEAAQAADLVLAQDNLGIFNQGTNPGQIGVGGGFVTYGGTSIGSVVSSGAAGTDLVVQFNGNATPAAVEALIENLTYANSASSPVGSRTLSISVSDGDGGTSVPRTVVVNITPETDGAQLLYINERVNTYGADTQQTPDAARLSDGGYITVWASDGQDGWGYGVYAQRFDSKGVPLGAEFRVNTSTPAAQWEPAVAGLTGGGYVVTWRSDGAQDGSGSGVYAQRFSNDGVAQGAEFRVNTQTSNNQYQPAITGTADGGFVIAYYTDNTADAFFQRYNAAGVAQGAESSLHVSGQAGTQSEPALAGLPGGGFIAVWSDSQADGSSSGVFAARFDASGVRQGAVFQVNTYTASDQFQPDVAVLNDGGYVVVWTSLGQDASSYGVYAQRYNSAGATVGSEFRVNTATPGNQSSASVVALSHGGFAVSWYSDGRTLVQQFDVAGTRIDGELRVDTLDNNANAGVNALVPLVNGGFVVTWGDYDYDGSTFNIHQQLLGQPADFLRQADPVLVDVAPSVTFAENTVNAAPQLIDNVVGLSDADSVNFDGGTLEVNYLTGYSLQSQLGLSGLAVQDQLGIRSQGIGASQINVSGSSVRLGSTEIGTIISNGQNGAKLTVQLNANASVFAVERLIENLTYANTFSDPAPSRTVSVRVTDGDGGASVARSVVINVTPEFDGAQPLFANDTVNTYTAGTQDTSDMALLSDGSYVTVWTSVNGQDGWEAGVYGQRYDAKGVPLGSEFQVHTFTPFAQTEPTVIGLTGGGYVVAWRSQGQDGSGAGVYAQRFSNDGLPQGSEFRVNTSTSSNQYLANLAATADGGFVVAWYTDAVTGPSESSDVFFQRYNASGVPQGSETRANPTGEGSSAQYSPALAGLPGGGFVAVWTDNTKDGSGEGIYGQRFTAAGLTSGPSFKVNTYTTSAQNDPQIAVLSGGGFVVTWSSSGQDSSGEGVYAQRYDASGAPLGTEFRVNTTVTGTQNQSAVTPLADGGFAVAWTSNSMAFVQQFDANGVRVDGEQRLDTLDTNANASVPAVLGLAGGGFVVSWTDYDYTEGTYNVYQQVMGQPANFVRQADPVLVDVNASVTFGENLINVTPQVLDAGVGLVDVDSANFDGGTLEVNYITGYGGQDQLGLQGLDNQDQLGIRSVGTGNRQISVSLDTVSYGNQPIGTIVSNGANGSKLTVRFNANATVDAVEHVIENLTYANNVSNPVASRTVSIRLTDGDGGASEPRNITINVTPENDGAVKFGAEKVVNTTVAGNQMQPSVARLSDGGYVVVWEDQGGADGSAYGVYGQRYDANNNPAGAQFRSNTFTTGNQYDAQVVGLSGGGYVVAWRGDNQDGSGTGVYAQRYDATGAPSGGEFRVNTTTSSNQYQPALTATSDGGFIVAWYHDSSTPATTPDFYEVFFQRYNASGVAQGAETRASPPIAGQNFAVQSEPAIAWLKDADGGFVVTWTDSFRDGNGDGVYAQRYTAGGVAEGAVLQVNSYTVSTQQASSVTALNDGGFVVVWTSEGEDLSSTGIYGQRYDASGVRSGTEFRINTNITGQQYQPQVAALANGGWAVTWTDTNIGGWDVFVQQYDVTGRAVDGETLVNSYRYAQQQQPSIVGMADGGFVVAYAGVIASGDGDSNGLPDGGNDSFEIRLQRFSNTAPVVTNVSVQGQEEAVIVLSNTLFESGFIDPEGQSLQAIQIIELPAEGTLRLNGVPVTPNQIIGLADLQAGLLTYQGDLNYFGNDQFRWTGSDGIAFATTPVFTNIVLSNVNDAPGLATLTNVNGSEGNTISRTLTLTDPDPDNRQFTVVWGDGSPNSVFTSSSNTPQISHNYADNGNYTVTVTVNDQQGQANSIETGSFQAVVANVAPTISLSGASSVPQGQPYTLTLANPFDPGADTVDQYTIDWGDGSPIETYTPAQVTAAGRSFTHTFNTAGPELITVGLRDEDGTYASAGTQSLTVQAPAEQILIDAASLVPGVINEGSVFVRTITFVDPTDQGVPGRSFTVNWGDGQTSNGTLGVDVKSFNIVHTYADNGGPFNVQVTVDDSGTVVQQGVGSFAVTVNNVAPTVVISGAGSINEGSLHTITLTPSDPGTDTISQYVVKWGDGASETYTAATLPANRQLTHTYADGTSVYTISVDVTDEDGVFANAGQTNLTVFNVAPTAPVTGPDTVNEGSGYTLNIGAVVDPGADTRTGYSINWGDGSPTTNFTPAEWAALQAAGGNVNHVFADGGAGGSSRTVNVNTSDEDGTFTLGSKVVTVANVAPTLVLSGAATSNEAATYTLGITASDPAGANDPLNYSIDWGDGSPLQTLTAAQLSTLSGLVPHVYADDADGPVNSTPRTISVTVNDGDNGVTTQTQTLNVNNVAPTAPVSGAATVNEGSSYTLSVGAVVDPGPDTRTGYSINWGDGSTDSYTPAQWASAAGSFSHTYADGAASATIVVSTTDEDGTFTLGSQAVNVLNVNPTLNISGAASINEGSSYALTINASDPAGANDPLSYSIDWGDGSALQSLTAAQLATLGGTVSHVYADDQDGPVNSTPRNISVTVSDGDGGSATQGRTVNVNNVAPTITLGGGNAAQVAQPYTLVLGAITDPGTDTVSSYTINWGDGSALQTLTAAQVAGLGGNVPHTYAAAGSFGISVALVDEDGSYNDAGTQAVVVSAQVPTVAIEAGPDGAVNEGSAFTRSINFTDGEDDGEPGWSYSINYGDGSAVVNGVTLVKTIDLNHVYADGNATRTVTVTVEDGVPVPQLQPSVQPAPNALLSESASDSFTVTVNNVAPTATVSGAATANEGSSYVLTVGAVSDPGADTRTGYTINWGDGSTDSLTPAQWASAAGSFSHTYADGAAAATIVVSTTDEDGTFTLGSKAINVLNVNPTLNISGAAAVNEGSSYALSISASDPAGVNDPLSYSIDWGDGSALQSLTAAQLATLGGTVSHVYTDDEDGPVNSTARSISVTVSDGDGGSATAGRSINVNNVAPTATVSGAATANEGSAYVLTVGAVSDPGADTRTGYTINWGDGSTDSYTPAQWASAAGSFSHTYADGAASATIVVSTTDEDGTFTLGSQAVNVLNVNPTLNISGAASINEGGSYALSINASDPAGVNDPLSYSIDWGDGSALQSLTAAQLATLGGTVSHVYADDQDGPVNSTPRNISVTVSDGDGGSATAGRSVNVNNVAPTIALGGGNAAQVAQPYTLVLGAITDPGTDTVSSYTINWGDGSALQTLTAAQVAGLGGNVPHTYAAAGSFGISVTLVDEDGSFANAGAQSVVVSAATPTVAIEAGPNGTVNEGGTFTRSISFTDGEDNGAPGWTYSIDYGDGSAVVTGSTLVKTIDLSHLYADGDATRTVTVSVSDGATESASDGFSVVVSNVAPTATVSGAATANEGSAYVLTVGAVSDPGADTRTGYTINWGDGSADSYTPAQWASAAGSFSHTYADGAASATIVVSTTDEDGTFSLGSQAVNVLNVNPTLNISGAASINEGGSYALSISASDPAGVNDPLSYSIDWGDGSALQSLTAAQLATLGGTVSHVYADDQDGPVNSTPRNISVTVSDGDGGSATQGRTVNVNNVAPTIALGGGNAAQVAQPYTLVLGAISDPGTDTVSSYTINWGDGSALQTLTAAQVAGLGGNVPHTYGAAGSFGISVTLVDEDGSFANAGAQTVVVSAATPIVGLEAGPDAALNEGATFTRSINFTDGADNGAPGWSYSINYGDGSPVVTGTTLVKTINLSHVYADGDATRTVQVSVSDDGTPTETASDSFAVVVSNVAPTATVGGAASVNEGGSYVLTVGAVSDPGADTRTGYTITWGDGSTDSLTPAQWASAAGSFSHTYVDGAASATIVVSTTDEDGTFTLGSKAINVLNVNPTLNISGAAAVNEGSSYALTISASDPAGANDPLSYSIDWGDGSALQSLTAAQLATLGGTVNHVYADDANGPVNTTPRSISVTVADGDGGSATQGRTVDVNNVAPTIALGGLGTSTVGLPYTLVLGAITDPGQDTVTGWQVNWGDGSPVQNYSAGGPVTHVYSSAGNPVISVGLVDEDGTWANAGTQAVSVSQVPTQSVTIGNAPPRLTLANLNAWVKAWTHPSITLSHRADADNASEAWSPVTLNNLAPSTLAGGDIATGDLGVSGQSLLTSAVAQEIDGSEGLRLALSLPAISATFNLSSLLRNDGGQPYAEAGRIQAFNSAGTLVAEKVFWATSATGSQDVSIAFAGGFSSLVVTSGAYNGSTFVDGAYANLDGSFGSAPIPSGTRMLGSDFLLHAATVDLVVPTVQLVGLAAPDETPMTTMLNMPSWAQV